MDAALLTSPAFWDDLTPMQAGATLPHVSQPSRRFWRAGVSPEVFSQTPSNLDISQHRELLGHLLFETSGSTGSPKWIALSKQALLISAQAVNQHLRVTTDSCWGLTLPLHHVGGFGVAARAYQAGCHISTYRGKWNAAAFRNWIAAEQVTHTSLVPTQVFDLVQEKLSAPQSLTAIVVGGGQLDRAIGQAARDLGWPVLASYGMTEACSQIATQGLERLNASYSPTPLALLPIWQVQVSEDQRLSISGTALFSGIISEGIYIPRSSDWYQTADLASIQGLSLTPLGRADNQIKILGELVDAAEIERELIALSHGRLAPTSLAVLAIPDERAGHLLVPVFEASVGPSFIDHVLHLYHQQAPGFRRLKPAVTVATFPRSALGKLRKPDLMRICLDQLNRPAV